MRKNLFAVLIVLSLVLALAGTAATPLSSVALASVVFVPGKGPVFTFLVDQKFSRSELHGTIRVEGGADYDLYCTQADATTVKCQAPKKTEDQNVMLFWGGGTFWSHVPLAPPQVCYNVYDFDSRRVWKNYGTHCQDRPASYGQSILWYNPDWDDTYEHVFQPDTICAPIVEDAYYFPTC